MLFLELSPIYLAVNVYFIYEILKWVDALKRTAKPRHIPTMLIKIVLGTLFGISTFDSSNEKLKN